MRIRVSGIGIWTHGITNWAEFLQQQQAPASISVPATAPAADIIPAREKRRVPLITRMAIEAGIQACRMAAIDPGLTTSVFSSCMGDTEVTDYMCRVLATPEKALSPTKFHNSVHNATSGYWSIFTQGHLSGGFAGAHLHSFATALIESAALSITESKPTLLVMYDVANCNPMHDACPIDTPLAYALLIQPASDDANGRAITLSIHRDDPDTVQAPALAFGFDQPGHLNPAADGLSLLTALANTEARELAYAASDGSTLRLAVASGEVPPA